VRRNPALLVTSRLGDGSLTRQSLENDPAIIYFLDRGLQITHCNFAWDRFANDNGGKDLARQIVLGRFVMDVIPPPLKSFYADAYHSVLDSRRPWECTYECSSANVFRSFRMAIYHDPVDAGLLVVNSLTIERPHGPEREPLPSPERPLCKPRQRHHHHVLALPEDSPGASSDSGDLGLGTGLCRESASFRQSRNLRGLHERRLPSVLR